MNFISVVTFCIGASVAEANPMTDCGWIEFSARPVTQDECVERNIRLRLDYRFMATIEQVIHKHPQFDNEWGISFDCVSEEDWPELKNIMMRSLDEAV